MSSPKLNVSLVVEEILVRAVLLHDPSDYRGMAHYARVMPEHHIPRVVRAIFKRAPGLSFARATARGHLAALSKRAEFSAPVACPFGALNRAMKGRHLTTVELWRGLPVVPAVVPTKWSGTWPASPFGVAPAAAAVSTIFASISTNFRFAFVVNKFGWTGLEWCAWSKVADAAVIAVCPGIASGAVTALHLASEAVSLAGIQLLNRAMASPAQALTSATLEDCTVDLPRLLAMQLPNSVTSFTLASRWVHPVPTTTAAVGPMSVSVQWPARLDSLTLARMKLFVATVSALVPTLPPTLTSLALVGCPVQDPAMILLLRALPNLRTLTLLDIGLSRKRLATYSPYFAPGLHSLDLPDLKFLVGTAPSKAAGVTIDQAGLALLAESLPPNLEILDMANLNVPAPKSQPTRDALIRPKVPAAPKRVIPPPSAPGLTKLLALAQRFPPTLEVLALSGCGLKMFHADVLAFQLPATLTHLDMRTAEIGGRFVFALKRRLPKARVVAITLDYRTAHPMAAAHLMEHFSMTVVNMGYPDGYEFIPTTECVTFDDD
ncbi:hypothetical protein H9P43_001229 [Blastocladiella emersonii ATCC 22665]|nr:hypothetical protein H9P43_001229 [Blastocladiella emersonii ATCC 22665]